MSLGQIFFGPSANENQYADQVKDEIREELEFHLAMASEAHELAGMSQVEARKHAELQFGNPSAIAADCQQIQLGEQRMLRRVQSLMTLAVLGVVLAFTLYAFRNQTRQHAAMAGLHDTLHELGERVTTIADRGPPVVVETYPAAGATNVDPAATEIRVTFNKTMQNHSWSWCHTQYPFPETTGQIHYLDDRRTCVMPVSLKPDTTYVLNLNSSNFQNFKDPLGQPATPYVLCFTTAPAIRPTSYSTE